MIIHEYKSNYFDMATVKIKFRPSTVEGRKGTIFYQVIHGRVVRQRKTSYRLYEKEWHIHKSEVIFSKSNDNRRRHLLEINNGIQSDIKKFLKIISLLEQSGREYTSDDIISEFESYSAENSLFPFMNSVVTNMVALGKMRTSETYAATLRSFMHFRNGKDVPMEDIDSDMMVAYEVYLRRRGVIPNSTSYYMRNLRAVYNRAVDKNLISQRFPFKHVYTGVDKTIKRAVPLSVMREIKALKLSENPTFEFARDMFMFSFYTRGMSFVDMAYLRKRDLDSGILKYRRRKTGQLLFIKWENCMQEIVEKYGISSSIYLLPIIRTDCDIEERKQYIYAAHNINRCLKIIGRKLELSISLTLYVARHSWASIAKSKNIPLSVISDGMGHDSEATTRIYLASLDTAAIDKANSLILKSL